MPDRGSGQIAFRLLLKLGREPRRALATVGEGKQTAAAHGGRTVDPLGARQRFEQLGDGVPKKEGRAETLHGDTAALVVRPCTTASFCRNAQDDVGMSGLVGRHIADSGICVP